MYVRPNIGAMQAYVPGEQPTDGNFIKLNTNENPYPPSPAVVRAILTEAWGPLNLYPDIMSSPVRERLARIFGLKPDNFLVGNGGDDILTIVSRSLAGEKDAIAYPTPSYILYQTLAELQGSKKIETPYSADYSIPKKLFGNKAKLTFLANPNSPSSTSVPMAEVRRLAESLNGVLVVDEAYADFADENCMSLVGKLPNLCVLRSFSKSFGLAGMRIGYLAAPETLITEFAKAKDSYNVNRISIAAAAAALDDYGYMLDTVAKVKSTRRRLSAELAKLGFDVMPAASNFIWAAAPAPGAGEIYRRLKARRIFIRFWDRPGFDTHVRISIGTDEQVDSLLGALREIVGAANA